MPPIPPLIGHNLLDHIRDRINHLQQFILDNKKSKMSLMYYFGYPAKSVVKASEIELAGLMSMLSEP